MPAKIDDILDEDITSLPAVYYKLREAFLDPECSYKDCAKIISLEPGLAARLLRIVNSSFYGFSEKIETIYHALSIIGVDHLNNLVLATAVINKFKGIPEELVDMKSFWRHGVACGMAAREIGERKKTGNTEPLYLAGLLHDIGSLIIYNKLPNKAKDVFTLCEQTEEPLFQVEYKVMGFNHTDIGSALLKAWKLPMRLVEAASFHHHPLQAKEFPIEAGMVHLADIIAYELNPNCKAEPLPPPLEEEVWKQIDMPPAVLPSVQDYIEIAFEETVSMFLD